MVTWFETGNTDMKWTVNALNNYFQYNKLVADKLEILIRRYVHNISNATTSAGG